MSSRWAQWIRKLDFQEQSAGRIPLEVLEEHMRTTKPPLWFYSQHQFPLKIYLKVFSFKVIFLLRSMLLLLLHIYSFISRIVLSENSALPRKLFSSAEPVRMGSCQLIQWKLWAVILLSPSLLLSMRLCCIIYVVWAHEHHKERHIVKDL